MRRLLGLLVGFAILFGHGASLATDGAFKLVAHPDNPVTAVDVAFVRDAYFKRKLEWKSGDALRPLDLSDGLVRARFTRDVLGKTPSQLRNYWSQRIFSGKGVPPPVAATPADAIAFVLTNPGALAYLPVGVDHGRAKVIRIE
jgi:hypothetical protein